MKQIAILTTNPEKQAQAKAAFHNSEIQIEFVELETPEIQAYTCEEVARTSVQFAFRQLQKPVVVTDAGYFIRAVNGFPGPFLKFVNTMLSSQDILQIMDGKRDRKIDLHETIAYMDTYANPFVTTSKIEGTLATTIRGNDRTFDNLFIPNGYAQTASELGKSKMMEIYLTQFTHWRSLREHLEGKSP